MTGRLRSVYAATAIVVLNTFMLFVMVNLVAAAVLVLDSGDDGPRSYDRAWLIEAYGLDVLARNYPGMSQNDLVAFLRETSNWVQQYEPFTGLRPVARLDRFITIAPEGFRPVPGQAPWPPREDSATIFLFGGSTMMGAGVPDDGTIAAHLQRELDSCAGSVKIYNFGRGYYFSTQERILFEQLLLAGHRPDAVVFLDGLNDFYFADGVPQFTEELTTYMRRESGERDERAFGHAMAIAARALPVVQAADRFGLITRPDPVLFGSAPEQSTLDDSTRVNDVLRRWVLNSDLIRSAAAAHGVRAAFVWQPVPTYGYDITRLNVYRAGVNLFGAHALSSKGYAVAAERHRRNELGPDVLWLGDMQRNRAENLYVDAVHYTVAFSAEIARRVAEFVRDQELVPCVSGRVAP